MADSFDRSDGELGNVEIPEGDGESSPMLDAVEGEIVAEVEWPSDFPVVLDRVEACGDL